ncbi:MAG: 2-hydroxy-3-oxopropionate reductase [Thermomicrobiales bacterium]|nr:2-hydroxy-3-oxopropionate reductase [Thermomicrobiales bacterium]
MAERIGFIGLGIMGKPMVRNLANAGYKLVLNSRRQESVAEMVAEIPGAIGAATPFEVAKQADVVIMMVPDSPDVEKVVFGEGGLIEAVKPGSLIIDMSTIATTSSLLVHEAVATRGGQSLDAPVSGGDKGAIAGTLSIMVGGSAEAFDRAKPIFEAMGKTIVHCGGPGAGQTVKSANQIAVAVNIAGLAEALVFAAKAGVEPAKVLEVLGGGLATSRVLDMRGPGMIKGEFTPGFRIDLHRKDLNNTLATARTQGSPIPVTALVSQLFDAASSAGRGQLDHSGLLTILEDLAGVQVKDV